MPTFDRITDFLKSGAKRFTDAEELMQAPTVNSNSSDALARHLRGAMYLAGYGVECLLKAYLCDQEGCQSLRAAQAKINVRRTSQGLDEIRNVASSAAGHGINYLIRLSDLATRPGYDPKLWGRVARWDSTWRYNPTPVERAEAEKLLSDIKQAMDYIRPKVIAA